MIETEEVEIHEVNIRCPKCDNYYTFRYTEPEVEAALATNRLIEKLRREIRSDAMELRERRVESSRHYFLKGRIDGNKETLARLEQIQGK